MNLRLSRFQGVLAFIGEQTVNALEEDSQTQRRGMLSAQAQTLHLQPLCCRRDGDTGGPPLLRGAVLSENSLPRGPLSAASPRGQDSWRSPCWSLTVTPGGILSEGFWNHWSGFHPGAWR